MPHFTPSERAVLVELNRGRSNAQIATHFGWTTGSAAAAVGRVMIKLGGGGRCAVVERARDLGLVPRLKSGLQPRPRRSLPPGLCLTPDERRLLRLINEGLDNAAIAGLLRIPIDAIRERAHALARRLGGGTRLEIVERARAGGLVPHRAEGLQRRSFDPADPILTPRERETLDLMHRGCSNAQIAKRMRVSLGAAQSLVSAARTAIGGSSRYAVVERARSLGLVDPLPSGGLGPITLTALQRRVIVLAGEHLTPTRIGRRLRRSAASVTQCLMHLKKRLGTSSNLATYERALALGALEGSVPQTKPHPFTDRETEIIEGLWAGLSHRQIGLELGVAKGVIGNRVRVLKAKMRARSVQELLDEVDRLKLFAPRRRRPAMVARATLRNRRPARHGALGLTPRMLEVIAVVARWPDRSRGELAEQLGMAPNTFQGHLTSITQRLDVERRRDIPARALELGLVASIGRSRRRSTA